ncbi:MAG: hypothetical protein NZ518_00040 [Dehalococcoidia bacterium]|nr:hypothetical protein [Dehalococcoidia bacterium]
MNTKARTVTQFDQSILLDLRATSYAAGNHDIADLPPDIVITGGRLLVVTASDASAETLGLSIQDQNLTLASGVSATSTGATALTLPAVIVGKGQRLRLSVTRSGAATQGRYIVVLTFSQLGRGESSHAHG